MLLRQEDEGVQERAPQSAAHDDRADRGGEIAGAADRFEVEAASAVAASFIVSAAAVVLAATAVSAVDGAPASPASASCVTASASRTDESALTASTTARIRARGRPATLPSTLAIDSGSGWVIAAAVIVSVALVVTILGNVPINIRTGRIDAETAPEGFIAMRRRWDVFQVIRGSLQLMGFVVLAVGLVGV